MFFLQTWELVALVRLLLHNELDVPEVNLILELVFDLLPELAKVEVPLLLHALHHQLHLQDLQKFIIYIYILLNEVAELQNVTDKTDISE